MSYPALEQIRLQAHEAAVDLQSGDERAVRQRLELIDALARRAKIDREQMVRETHMPTPEALRQARRN